MSVHNAILAEAPDMLPPLYDGLPYITTEADGPMEIWNGPVFDVTDYEAVTAGAGYLVRRNVRAYGEATWDRGLEDVQGTLGLTLAF